jgi:hypothetical protein
MAKTLAGMSSPTRAWVAASASQRNTVAAAFSSRLTIGSTSGRPSPPEAIIEAVGTSPALTTTDVRLRSIRARCLGWTAARASKAKKTSHAAAPTTLAAGSAPRDKRRCEVTVPAFWLSPV